jgi:hypothetical protein
VRATAAQPAQHIGRAAPSIMASNRVPAGTGSPQWKHAPRASLEVTRDS